MWQKNNIFVTSGNAAVQPEEPNANSRPDINLSGLIYIAHLCRFAAASINRHKKNSFFI
jgi:hypothetical protein